MGRLSLPKTQIFFSEKQTQTKKQWKRKIGFHNVLFARVIKNEMEAFPSLTGGGKVKNSKQITVHFFFFLPQTQKDDG